MGMFKRIVTGEAEVPARFPRRNNRTGEWKLGGPKHFTPGRVRYRKRVRVNGRKIAVVVKARNW